MAVAPDMDKNVKNKVGQTALHWHVQKDDLGMVVTLITMGVDMDAQDLDGNTPLHLAVSVSELLSDWVHISYSDRIVFLAWESRHRQGAAGLGQ